MIRALVAHNFYQESGGEDQVFAAESSLLKALGHDVSHYTVRNEDIADLSNASLAISAIWNNQSYKRLRSIIRQEKPDILHLHNTLPLISPAAYYAARHENVAVVQTLHNYRLICPSAVLFRDGSVCEQCLNKLFPWPGVQHGCYRNSIPASGVVASMLAAHKLVHTWIDKVDVFIALTEFAREKFIEGGLPADKILVKPNFLMHDPERGAGSGSYALFVGRLSPEKGIETLLDAWSTLGDTIPLKIVGDGPLAPLVRERAKETSGVDWLGRLSHDEVLRLMKDAYVLVFPSVWYEGFPMTIVEAYAVGLPVIGSRLGSMASVIEHEKTGLHFHPGDVTDLAKKLVWSVDHPEAMEQMRVNARAEFETKYNSRRNYTLLMRIYERAIASAPKQ